MPQERGKHGISSSTRQAIHKELGGEGRKMQLHLVMKFSISFSVTNNQ